MTAKSAAVTVGIGNNISTYGKLNHLSNMRGLIHGVAIEIATTPRAVNQRLLRAH